MDKIEFLPVPLAADVLVEDMNPGHAIVGLSVQKNRRMMPMPGVAVEAIFKCAMAVPGAKSFTLSGESASPSFLCEECGSSGITARTNEKHCFSLPGLTSLG